MRTKRTTAAIPYNPQGLGVSLEDGSVHCEPGEATVGGHTYSVSEATFDPHELKTKIGQLDVYLVYTGDAVEYVAQTSSPDSPSGEPDGTVLCRVARVVVHPGEREDRRQLIRPVPMTEESAEPVRNEDGEQMFTVWKRASEVPRSEAQKYADHDGVKLEPQTETQENPVTK